MATLDLHTAATIANEWLDAFNAHRADRVVEHFAEDVTARSPAIARLRPASGGSLEGQPAVLSFSSPPSLPP